MTPKTQNLTLTAEMQTLIQRAEQGDRTALEPLRELLTQRPELWAMYGDMSRWAQTSWLDLVSGTNLCLRESVELKLQQLRDELGEADAAPLEKLLIQRVSISWLMVHYSDARSAQLRAANAGAAQVRVVEDFSQKAHHRYLSAIRQLAQVRKLLTPPRSPIEIASRLTERRPAPPATSRERATLVGAAVEN